jgi:AraC-like DNA-binding protein
MPSLPALLVGYLPDPRARSRLVAALEQPHAAAAHAGVRLFGHVEHVVPVVRESRAGIAVLDVFADAGAAELLPELHRSSPWTRVLAYSDFRSRSPQQILELGSLGVAEAIALYENDGAVDIAAAIARGVGSSITARAADALRGTVAEELRALFDAMLTAAERPLTPRDAARIGCCHPDTLRERLARGGLPPVNKLIVWLRLIQAAARLELTGHSAARVARWLEFPSETALRNQLRRYADVAPGELTRPGGLEQLLAEFRWRQHLGDWTLHEPSRRERR